MGVGRDRHSDRGYRRGRRRRPRRRRSGLCPEQDESPGAHGAAHDDDTARADRDPAAAGAGDHRARYHGDDTTDDAGTRRGAGPAGAPTAGTTASCSDATTDDVSDDGAAVDDVFSVIAPGRGAM